MAKKTRKTPKKPLVDVVAVENDNLGKIVFNDFLTPEQRGSDKFLDLVTWNIKWFNVKDPKRVDLIAQIMAEINADVFVLQEIEDQSMEPVIRKLFEYGAGSYKSYYGSLGGDQRVTLLYDTAFVRATSNPTELFSPDLVIPGTRKRVFPRLPVQVGLTVLAREPSGELSPFDFELVGLHLKSQRPDASGDDGTAQREEAARKLAEWIEGDATDSDLIMAGDWNTLAERPEFAPIRALEEKGEVAFESYNPKNEASHLFKNGKKSRLDYIMLSAGASKATSAAHTKAEVLQWTKLDGSRKALEWIVDNVSDHLPVIGRFYFFDED
ncbi:endonuclease/exonuclease/phosphatase family protein [Rhabdaerophilum calidifontis]|uniref:endonuclease/exonuclease/phosphatase family protein n=1 Tax=Rhabdaerophilum calidifontis TaxID=2604328 RepID=UPI0012386660|nr:endonuclease/exonuclease/phosphatase family protein [Rhabdaerophilum calidifontis]